MSEVTIRPAMPEDAQAIAWLLMAAWPVESFLGMNPGMTKEEFADIVSGYVKAEDTLYSYTNTIVAVAGDGICGAINGYDGAKYESLKKPIIEDFRKRFPGDSSDFARVRETEAGEFYLDSIGVSGNMRSMGIGSKLFEAMLERARKAGFRKAGLIVDTDKPKAEALYLRLGFKVAGYKDFFGHSMKHMQIDLD